MGARRSKFSFPSNQVSINRPFFEPCCIKHLHSNTVSWLRSWTLCCMAVNISISGASTNIHLIRNVKKKMRWDNPHNITSIVSSPQQIVCPRERLSFLSMHMLIGKPTGSPSFGHCACRYSTQLPSCCLISVSALPLPLRPLIQWLCRGLEWWYTDG